MSMPQDTAPDLPNEHDLPLANVRVVDLTGQSGEMGPRILADLGADVIRVEPIVVDRPSAELQEFAGLDVRHETHNANKRSVSLDLDTTAGIGILRRLLQTADIFIEGLGVDRLTDLGLEPAALRREFPTLVIVSFSDFGRTGPYRNWTATELVHVALGGVLSRSGLPGRPPLVPPGPIALESAAVTTAWAALLAYYNRLLTDSGDDVDVSVFESTVQIIDPGFGMAGSAAGGVPTSDGPRGRPDSSHLYPIFPCTDGYVRLCILSPRQWQGMFEWMGRPAEFADPELGQLKHRYAAVGTLYPAIEAFLSSKSRTQAVTEGQQFGVPCGELLDFAEVLDSEHYSARDAFAAVPTPLGTLRIPNGLMEIDGTRAGIRRRAPRRGEYDTEIFSDLPPLAGPSTANSPRANPVRRRPLDGIRVLDLGVIVAGGETGRLLADMGAEVIKIENTAFRDGSRQSMSGALITPVFAWGHRNKKSIGINLRSPEGRTYIASLVEQSDVVLSNFKPGTMDKLGLSYQELSRINPRIVVADSSAFGNSGPWNARLGYGPLVRASTGLSLAWKYDTANGGFADASTIYPDHAAARVSAIGVLAQLVRRLKTNRGGTVSVAQAEVILAQHSDLFASASVRIGTESDRGTGNTPSGLYPAAGTDEWIVIDVRDSDEWERLAKCIGSIELVSDPRFETATKRLEHRAALDAVIENWTRSRSPRAAVDLLQESGVPGAMMLRLPELPEDPHLQARQTFRVARHPLIDRLLPSENTPARFENIPDVELRPAPLLGEQTREIASTLLGLSDEDIDRMIAAGVLEEELPPIDTDNRSVTNS